MTLITRMGRLGAILAAAGGLAIADTGATRAADLDYDYPRHSSYKDYWGDTERDERYSDIHDQRCVPRHVVRKRLVADGWHDFDNADPRGHFVVVDARRDGGRLFRLKIDRCTGHILTADALEAPRPWRRLRDDWDDDRPRWRRWADGPRHYRRDDWRHY